MISQEFQPFKRNKSSINPATTHNLGKKLDSTQVTQG